MDKEKKKRILRVVIVSAIIIVLFLFAYIMIPFLKSVNSEKSLDRLLEWVQSSGIFAPVVYIGLCIIQVIVAFIPGEPLEIVGGVIFGGVFGSVLCIAGIIIGQIIVYYLVKKIGKPLINLIMSKEKYNQLKVLNDEKRLETLIFVLFLIPGTPKDALTYFVPVTKIRPSKYFMLTAVARIPSVVSSTILGANITNGKWKVAVVIFAVTALVGFVGILYNNKLMNTLKERSKKINENIKKHKKSS